MEKNDFNLNSQKREMQDFNGKIGTLVSCAIFLTGIFLVSRLWFLGRMMITGMDGSMRFTAFAWQVLISASVLCCFISLVKIAVDRKPFSKVLTYCLWSVGGLFAAGAVIFPRLSDYQSSGFEIFSRGSFVLVDGMILLPGILLIIFGSLIKAGFEMQREIDEIL